MSVYVCNVHMYKTFCCLSTAFKTFAVFDKWMIETKIFLKLWFCILLHFFRLYCRQLFQILPFFNCDVFRGCIEFRLSRRQLFSVLFLCRWVGSCFKSCIPRIHCRQMYKILSNLVFHRLFCRRMCRPCRLLFQSLFFPRLRFPQMCRPCRLLFQRLYFPRLRCWQMCRQCRLLFQSLLFPRLCCRREP